MRFDEMTLEQRQEIAAKGGRARRKSKVRTCSPDEAPPPPETLDDCVAWASWIARAAATGLIDSGTARVCTNAIAELRRSIHEKEIENRVAELERMIKKAKRDRERGRG